MPVPFPGMDPWLEAPGLFPDLHQTLIGEIRNAIAAQLPEPYYTGLATRLYIEESQRYVEPDINVLTGGGRPKRSPGGGTAVLDATTPLQFRIKSRGQRSGRTRRHSRRPIDSRAVGRFAHGRKPADRLRKPRRVRIH